MCRRRGGGLLPWRNENKKSSVHSKEETDENKGHPSKKLTTFGNKMHQKKQRGKSRLIY